MTERLHIWSLDRMLVCLPSSAPQSMTSGLDEALAREPSVDGVLAVLTVDGLATTPEFLCAEVRPDGVRVLIRGDLQAVAHGPDLSVPLSSGRSGTWNDDVITDIESITFDIGADDNGATFKWVAGMPHMAGLAPATAPDQGLEETDDVDGSVDEIPEADDATEVVAEVRAEDGDHRTLREGEFRELAADGLETVEAPEADQEPATDLSADPSWETESETPSTSDEGTETAGDPLDFSNLLDSTQAPTSAPAPAPVTQDPAQETPDPTEVQDDQSPPDPDPGAEPEPTPVGVAAEFLEHAPPPPEPEPLPPGVQGPPPGARPRISAVPGFSGQAEAHGVHDQVPPPPPPAPPADGAGEQPVTSGLGDHDGYTMTLSDLQRLREATNGSETAGGGFPTPEPEPRNTEVRAVRCPTGHANPPTSSQCRVCGAGIADSTVHVIPRPTLARLVFDSGLVVDVDRPQLIGRKPTAPTDVDEIPNLITVPSPDSDISRSHTCVRLEGWDLLVEDVGSTNGTEIKLPNQDPMRIREHEPILVVPGTEVTLAGAVRFRVDPPAQ